MKTEAEAEQLADEVLRLLTHDQTRVIRLGHGRAIFSRPGRIGDEPRRGVIDILRSESGAYRVVFSHGHGDLHVFDDHEAAPIVAQIEALLGHP